MTSGPRRRMRRNRISKPLVWFLLLSAANGSALAQERTAPTPNRVIYPGDIISGDMLVDTPAGEAPLPESIVSDRAALVGKVAKRTLLPGDKILATSIATPRAVANGAHVTLVYREGALSIVTSALALESGGVGETIKVRNEDSGLTVSGTIQPDGAVSVGGG